MARKGLVVFPGPVYHLINRGNYRRDLFEEDETRAAFEDCFFAACRKSSWLLHAFVIMRNHFQLALETPEANLLPGMPWLQGTFVSQDGTSPAHVDLDTTALILALLPPSVTTSLSSPNLLD